MDLKNKNIAIVGASGGIGSALTTRLDAEGAHLYLIGRNSKPLQTYISKQHFFPVDISDFEKLDKLIADLNQKTEKIDVLINAAGIGVYKNIEQTTDQDLSISFLTNVEAPFKLIKGLLPLLQKTSDSLVLNIGSGAGVIPMRGRSVYCATKFALRGMTLSLAEEFEGKLPHFCLITLGSTLTNFAGTPVEKKLEEHKKGRAYFTPEWIANKLVEIIKDDNRKTENVLYPGDFGFGTWKKP